jgi:hypothetical protein
MIKAIPKIQRNPRTVSQNAMHYGYVAYHDIALGNQRVQPEGSPYYHVLPCRELIPFTNIEVSEIDEKQVQNGKRPKGQPPIKMVQKTAFECATEVESSYADWNFQILDALTGLSEDDAFRVFQTVQPFPYKLKDLQIEIGQADNRIDQDEPYTVTYEGNTVTLNPLSEDEKERARAIQQQVAASANQAVELGTDKWQKTITSMTRAFAGGDGKVTPDPLDKYLANEFGTKPPQLVDVQQDEAKKQTEADTLKREEIDLRREELEIRKKELEFREKESNKAKMEQVRSAKKTESIAA